MHDLRRSVRWAAGILALALTSLVLAGGPVRAPSTVEEEIWLWPLTQGRLESPFVAPTHRYAAGHRGIDIAVARDPRVRAPDDAVVAFAGRVAGRGVLTLDHGGELVSTFEPVEALVAAGDVVERGDVIALLDAGGHAAPGRLHVGLRLAGEYINPMTVFGGIPRAVLLPCC